MSNENAPYVPNFDKGEDWEPALVSLSRPFILFGNEYKVAKIRVPTGRDIELHIKGGFSLAEMKNLAIALTGWTDEVFSRMSAGDQTRIMNAVGEFMADAR